MYVLLDLRRRRISVKGLVTLLEDIVIEWLGTLGIAGQQRLGAPGVYVGTRKIASLGLRIHRGCSYHGLSLNVAMDLCPFSSITPCGLRGVTVTQVQDLASGITVASAGSALANAFERALSQNRSRQMIL
jgi:lipoyl(octanoyl) transferase